MAACSHWHVLFKAAMLSWSSPSSPGGACQAPCYPGHKYGEKKGGRLRCPLEWGQQGGEGRQGLSPAARGGCGSMLGPHRPEHRGELLCTGHLPAAGATCPSPPLCPRCLLEGSRAAPKALGTVLEPPGEGESLWERSPMPLEPLWQLRCCRDTSAQPPGAAPHARRAFSPCKA